MEETKKSDIDDFELNNPRFNKENNFSVIINLDKTCYFKGDVIKGNIILQPQDVVKKSLLLYPITANATLLEIHNYLNGGNVTEENILFKYPLKIQKFEGSEIINGKKIPFEFQIPDNVYPSLIIIDRNSYIRHILVIDFSSIEVKKSIMIIIKNEQYYSPFNGLYKSPIEVTHSTTKHKFALFYVGSISGKVKLEKNAFAYDEAIPIIIDIDCSTLTIRIQKVIISIYLVISRNNKTDHKQAVWKTEKIVFSKKISLLNQKDKYHLEDIIQLPKGNPNQIYKILDCDNRKYSEKYKDILLYPSCFGGLLTCEYFLKVIFETNTLFSTNEFIVIPLDFYENENNQIDNSNSKMKIMNNDEDIISTPKPFSNSIKLNDNYSFNRSNTQRMNFDNKFLFKNQSQKEEENNNILNNNDNEQKEKDKNKNSINIKQEMVTKEKDEIESFDAPPSIINNNDK